MVDELSLIMGSAGVMQRGRSTIGVIQGKEHKHVPIFLQGSGAAELKLLGSALSYPSHFPFCKIYWCPYFPVFQSFPSTATIHSILQSPGPCGESVLRLGICAGCINMWCHLALNTAITIYHESAVGQSMCQVCKIWAVSIGRDIPFHRWGWRQSKGLLKSPSAHNSSPGALTSEPIELHQILVFRLPLNPSVGKTETHKAG